MEIENNKNTSTFITSLLICAAMMIIACSKNDEGLATDAVYSGTGNFDFTGDYNDSFSGNVQNVKITVSNEFELLPLSFINNQGKELFIGLQSSKLEARVYTMKEIDSEGYAAYQFSTGLYDTGAIGGKGKVTIQKINGSEINGSVDMRLARPLNTADTVVVKGSFQLKAQ